jgi:hypothetical protein
MLTLNRFLRVKDFNPSLKVCQGLDVKENFTHSISYRVLFF